MISPLLNDIAECLSLVGIFSIIALIWGLIPEWIPIVLFVAAVCSVYLADKSDRRGQ